MLLILLSSVLAGSNVIAGSLHEDRFERQTSFQFPKSVKVASVDIYCGPFCISFHGRCGCPSCSKAARSTLDTQLPTSKTFT